MGKEKFCPKCDNQQMARLSLTESVPAAIELAGRRINVVPQIGLPFQAYECPKCGLVEIYKTHPIQE